MVDIGKIPIDEYGVPVYSPTNNARKIVLDACRRNEKHPNSSSSQKLEADYGIVVDYSEADAGEEPRHADYSHIISDPSNEEPF